MIYLVLVIVTLAIAFIGYLWSASSSGPKKRQKPPWNYTGKMIVNLEECYLISSSSPVEAVVPDSSPEVALVDPGMFDQDTKKITYATRIVFEKNGQKYVSESVDKDQTTMKYHLLTKKTTMIYFNPRNPTNYFFDLSFLEE